MAFRSRLAGVGFKPPGAAAFNRRGSERPRKRHRKRCQVSIEEMSESKPFDDASLWIQGTVKTGVARVLQDESGRYACRVCGDPDPGVHHREPGKSVLHLMIALCAGCHAKVHRTKVVLTEFPPLLLVLWREQHPEGHEQTYIDFNVRKPPAQSVPLNFEAATED